MEKTPWTRCLQVIKEQLNNQHVFDVWFSGIVFERYDEAAKTVTLQVPSNYVYEYLEQYHVPLMQKALNPVFGAGVVLQYRIMKQEPTFANVVEYLQQHGYNPRRDPYHIRIANARKRLEDGLRYFLGDGYTWLPAYDQVAEWLTDNKGRGLLCLGTPGVGKSLICQKVLPVILGNGGRPITSVSATNLHDRLPELLKERIVIIDDLGKEPAKHYGNVDRSFFELCNNAERTGQLLIITTNLSTTPVPDRWRSQYPLSIEERYGQEVLDRLKAITSMVIVDGFSMRK